MSKKYAYFMWDWKEWPPLAAITNVIRKHPDWKIYAFDTNGDWNEVFLAKDIESAKTAYRQEYKQIIEEAEEDGEAFEMPEIKEYED